jgi:cytochrome c biogenesis protein CcmG, thiol:disulfide interchange protein DsbE
LKNKSLIFIVLFIVSALVFILFSNQQANNKIAAIGLNAPEFEFLDPSSKSIVRSSDMKGKVIFLNFWATWCPPCREEIPSIEALYKEMSGNSNFRIVTVLYKDSYENGSEYMRSNGYTFPVYADDNGKSFKDFGLTGVPETYLIDKKGILRKHVIGPADWNSPVEKGLINSLLNE